MPTPAVDCFYQHCRAEKAPLLPTSSSAGPREGVDLDLALHPRNGPAEVDAALRARSAAVLFHGGSLRGRPDGGAVRGGVPRADAGAAAGRPRAGWRRMRGGAPEGGSGPGRLLGRAALGLRDRRRGARRRDEPGGVTGAPGRPPARSAPRSAPPGSALASGPFSLRCGGRRRRKEKLMEGNRDEAEKCIGIAREALEAGNRDRALRFLGKAQKLYPTETARGEAPRGGRGLSRGVAGPRRGPAVGRRAAVPMRGGPRRGLLGPMPAACARPVGGWRPAGGRSRVGVRSGSV